MVRITFIDGQHVDVTDETVLIGINNSSNSSVGNNNSFYLQEEYNSQTDNSAALKKQDKLKGIASFILSHHCFSIGNNEGEEIFMTTAVKSIASA